MVEVFALSLAVTVLCVYFGIAQGKLLSERIHAQRAVDRLDAPTIERDLGEVPEIEASWRAQSLDVAYNFPSAVLTLVAYQQLFQSSLANLVLIVIAVAIALYFRSFFDPHRAQAYWRYSVMNTVSIPTLVLFMANVVGLIVAVSIAM